MASGTPYEGPRTIDSPLGRQVGGNLQEGLEGTFLSAHDTGIWS